MLPTLASLVLSSSLPHVNLSALLEKDKPVVERLIGPGQKLRKGPGYLFIVKGFDHFWLLGYGKDMTRVVTVIGTPCTRDQALGCLGLNAAHASIKQIPLGNAPIATRRNCVEMSGVSGLPADPNTKQPWKVEFEEVGVVNKERMDALKPQINAATGDARIKLIRQCYDWRPKVSIQQ